MTVHGSRLTVDGSRYSMKNLAIKFNLFPFSIKAFIQSYILVCSLFLFYSFILAQHQNLTFEHFTNDNGLSAPVTHITQDHYGFLWLGTTDGLNRFDGRNFIVYRNIPGDTTSLTNNIINDFCVDSSGRVWVATNGAYVIMIFRTMLFIPLSSTIHRKK